ncbi:MAG TPA: hypothetical protein VFK90_10990 [Anaeromyxobacter sp.]|nr:hypothetical protein [Anaeromyxobacter sp.]
MSPRILAFRPASVVERLDARSHACPLSTRELLAPAAELGLALPVVHAALGAVARGALVAAKELGAVLGIAMPPDATPERWFDAVTEAADEVAAGSPIFLCGEVVVAGEDAMRVERAFHEAWRLVGAGITHLGLDVAAVAPAERARVVSEIAAAGVENGICVDVVLPLSEGAHGARRAAELLDELGRRGAAADVVSVRCPAPATRDEARLQAAALARICQALRGVAVMRRGPVTPELLDVLRGSPVRLCDDGGAISARAVRAMPGFEEAEPGGEPQDGRGNAFERAAAELDDAGTERVEARAYVDALDFLERLGARGTAPAIARALERRLDAQ